MNVAIIKYNAGNIFSIDYALRRLGIEPVITADKELIRKADKVIFPGVGEAKNTMEYLQEHQLDRLITDLKQPVLGICRRQSAPHGLEYHPMHRQAIVQRFRTRRICLFRA